MPKFNIYRIEIDKKDALVEKINSVGLDLTGSQINNNYTFDFYLSTNPEDIPIWWTDYYSEFIDSDHTITNKVNFGLLLISDSISCYAVSLGKSHFYIKPFCDTDFGINLAERIIDTKDLRLKNSKFYKTQKNKTITSYLSNTELSYDSGESLHYLKAKTNNTVLWGSIASFGQSVLFTLDLQVNQLTDLITRINQTLLSPTITSIPKAEKISNETDIANLDNTLVDNILDENNSNVDYQNIVLSGTDFIFSDNYQYQYLLKGTNFISETLENLTIDNLRFFVNEHSIDLYTNLNNIKIKVIREEGHNYTKSLKVILEFMTDERECLIDGNWHKFNQSYIDLLKSYVREIKINTHDPNLDIPIDNQIDETQFNTNRVDDGYLNLHTANVRIGSFVVEQMDLYKNGTLYFVKRGTPQKLNYVIDQALNTINLLKNNVFKIQNDNEELEVNKICLWLLMDRVTQVNTLDQIRSIIFLMKMMHLSKEIQDNRLEKLELNINYVR